jgi:hypothetical protein
MKKINIAAENKARLATIAPAAYNEGSAMSALGKVLQAAFKGRSTGTWDTATNKAVPSAYFTLCYGEYQAGSLAVMLPQFGNMSEADAIKAARLIIADPKRGEAANTALAAIRQRWGRGLQRAGIETPRPKSKEAVEAATKAREEAAKKRAAKSGQGKADPAKPSTFEQQAAKFMPPSEKTREALVAYARLQIANMIREIEKFNQHAAKVKTPAMPSNVIGDICDLQDRAKKWVF